MFQHLLVLKYSFSFDIETNNGYKYLCHTNKKTNTNQELEEQSHFNPLKVTVSNRHQHKTRKTILITTTKKTLFLGPLSAKGF